VTLEGGDLFGIPPPSFPGLCDEKVADDQPRVVVEPPTRAEGELAEPRALALKLGQLALVALLPPVLPLAPRVVGRLSSLRGLGLLGARLQLEQGGCRCRLDLIVVRREATPVQRLDGFAGVPDWARAIYPSDHPALSALFKLTNPIDGDSENPGCLTARHAFGHGS
jgi:hypothetical protein